MPFAFHIRIADDCIPKFSLPNHWSATTSLTANSNDSSDVHENIHKDSIYLLNDPLLVAEIAIKNIAMKGFRHSGIVWRHVALLPYECSVDEKNNKNVWKLKPILIDLAHVQKLVKGFETTQSVVLEDLNKLKDELKQLQNSKYIYLTFHT
jgi:hypothetical protein